MGQLREAILNLDPNVVTSDNCSTLLPFCPLPDEIKACQANQEPLEKLDQVFFRAFVWVFNGV